MEPLNLSTTPPRSPRVKVGGIVFTARIIDKLRAALPGGELNGYFAFTGFSELWAHYTRVDLLELQHVVEHVASEQEIEAWLVDRTIGIDREKINEKMERFNTNRTPDAMREVFEQTYPLNLRERHPILFDLLEADDARLQGPATMIPAQDVIDVVRPRR